MVATRGTTTTTKPTGQVPVQAYAAAVAPAQDGLGGGGGPAPNSTPDRSEERRV